jgi:uncharacterized protein (DUF885 family)
MRPFALLLAPLCVFAQSAEWVVRSNENARILLNVQARFSPESAGATGVEGLDEKIFDLQPQLPERSRAATKAAHEELKQRLAGEKNRLVRQDLEILIEAAEENLRASEAQQKLLVPYFNLAQAVFGGLRVLLDDQVAPARRQAALVRLRKYAGMEEGTTPVAVLAEARIRETLGKPGMLGPPKDQVERDLSSASFFVDGIPQLFDKYKITGYQAAHARLKEQLAAYHNFVNNDVLPKARTDFRLPPELYAINLESVGVDIPPAELMKMAHDAFSEIQIEMQHIAKRIAVERKLESNDYRDVIRELKKKQLVGDDILTHYLLRLEQIEAIIKREKLVTLPARAARIRIATPAESAALPAPHMRPPRLVGNRGETGEFVLPLNVPSAKGEMKNFDDFTFEAASWTLTAHEARPGPEMQFAAMVEHGVSTARAVFAFNSTNVEGWGLYSEYIMKPFMPLEGQLICLQHRLMRAARAFLDPELQMGKVAPAEALRILKEDAVLSDAMANQEVERYTFRSPGQATSYFYGYTKLLELRRDVEKKMDRKFNPLRFHDFVLSQGLLPPALLRKAVMEEFATN